MTVSIDTLSDETGLLIEDRIEQRQCQVATDDVVSPEPADTDEFLYPLDVAVTVNSSGLTVSQRPTAYLRDVNGELLEDIEHFTEKEILYGEFILEVPGPVKLYFQLSGPFTVSVDAVQMTLSFEGQRKVFVGARSYHEQPSATITTTLDPKDVMTAVSHFNSSLKTMSPERSYPNLRGHPPELSVGEELRIPDHLEPWDSGIRIEIPPTLIDTLIVAPLAYYIGADVEPGPHPRIVSDSRIDYSLECPTDLESEVERILKQVFFLDCLVRTEGSYGMPLHERQLVEPKLDLDFAELHELSAVERLSAYLAISYEEIAEYIPQWKMTAHVNPTSESVEILPFLVDDLAVIKSPTEFATVDNREQLNAIEEFARGTTGGSRGTRDQGEERQVPTIVEPEETDALEQAWIGDDVPIGASKAMIEAFRNRLAREEKDGDINIVVVCNDSEMLDEHHAASEVYGSRDELPFDVTLFDDLTKNRLRLVLESDIDYFHYIGHIDDGGFECTDGMLDVTTMNSIGVDTFFLNACQSYHQGVELIRKGSIGGVVTLDEVINSGAIRVGKAMTRLLNRGFPLRAALNIARERSIVGSQYIVVGDGNTDIAHGESLVPNLIKAERLEENNFQMSQETYYTGHLGPGAIVRPEISNVEEHFLVGSPLINFQVTKDQLEEFLTLEIVPTEIDSQFRWSDNINLDGF